MNWIDANESRQANGEVDIVGAHIERKTSVTIK